MPSSAPVGWQRDVLGGRPTTPLGGPTLRRPHTRDRMRRPYPSKSRNPIFTQSHLEAIYVELPRSDVASALWSGAFDAGWRAMSCGESPTVRGYVQTRECLSGPPAPLLPHDWSCLLRMGQVSRFLRGMVQCIDWVGRHKPSFPCTSLEAPSLANWEEERKKTRLGLPPRILLSWGGTAGAPRYLGALGAIYELYQRGKAGVPEKQVLRRRLPLG